MHRASDAITVDELKRRLRAQPRYWRVQLGQCDTTPGRDYCNRSDLCTVSRRRVAGEENYRDEIVLHGPPLLHPGTRRETLTVEETLNRLGEFPNYWPVFVGMCNSEIGRCEHEPVQHVDRGRAGRLLENVLIHGPLRHHK